MTILQIEGLTKDFGGLRALDKVVLAVQPGEIFGLIGTNGSGKTTMLNIITGFLKPTEGHISYKGELITGLRPHQIAKRGMARTFQLTSLFPVLTVEENVISGRHINSHSGVLRAFFSTKAYHKEEVKLRQEAMDILKFVRLQGKSEMIAQNLPAAEQRILEIAIALAVKPDLLLLDEPVSGMNLQETARVMELIRSIQQTGTTLVIIEHNMRVITELCSRIAVLDHGVKIAEGTPEEITNNNDVISVYLGKKRVGNVKS
jgi:branched-chain amino acid transport system ATP-binding protein